MLSLLRIERKQKNSSNAFRSYSFGIETITTFIRSRSSLKNHTRFQTKMGNLSVYPFLNQRGPKIITFGAAHTYMAYIREYAPRETIVLY